MNPIYLGIDIAGASNTWAAGLSVTESNLTVTIAPRPSSLCQIIQTCKERNVVAVAIDAQLTLSPSAENGFRASDEELRELLPHRFQNWVVSFNSLMAVPIRGSLLSDFLAPLVGTVLETHPRASLLFELGQAVETAIQGYKKGPDAMDYVTALWRRWSEGFDIQFGEAVHDDGALDSLVCATIAYLYHHEPGRLRRLKHQSQDIRGRGPFYVIAPTAMSEVPGA
jgi:predicted nuclease with RNAse H fold